MGNFEIITISPELMLLTEAAQDLGITPAGLDHLVRIGLVREYPNTTDAAARIVVCSDVARIGQLAALLNRYRTAPADPDPEPEPPVAVKPRPPREGFAA